MKTAELEKVLKRIERSDVVLFIVATVVLVLSMGLGRPLWTDEVLQFSMAAFPSFGDAWRAFVKSLTGITLGQTGAYFMLDYVLLKAFGASEFATRLPSYLSGVLLLYASHRFLETMKVRRVWQIWLMLGFLTQNHVSFYIGEARSYIVLAATSVGVLAYYSATLEERRKPRTKIMGWVSVVAGCLFHPYFAVYWAGLAILTALALGQWRKPAQLLKHANLPLVFAGSALFFGLGLATWMTHKPDLGNLDVFQWIPKGVYFPRFLFGNHFLFLKKLKTPVTVMMVFAAVSCFKYTPFKKFRPQILFSVAIVAFALAVSALVSYLSYRSGYWIIERQWVASVALATVGTAWFCAVIAELLPKQLKILWNLFLFGLVVVNAGFVGGEKAMWTGVLTRRTGPTLAETLGRKDLTGNMKWEALADANCREGGDVHPVFRGVYGVDQ